MAASVCGNDAHLVQRLVPRCPRSTEHAARTGCEHGALFVRHFLFHLNICLTRRKNHAKMYLEAPRMLAATHWSRQARPVRIRRPASHPNSPGGNIDIIQG